MQNGKPTGPKPKWWSRPRHQSPEAEALPVPSDQGQDRDRDLDQALDQDPALDRNGDRGLDRTPDQAPADSRAHADPARTEPVAPAAVAPVDDDRSEYTLAAPAPKPAPADAPDPADAAAPVDAPAVAPAPEGTPHAGLPDDPADHLVRPLHEPDEYRTPPYGGPGPWAPAPPVQRPVGTPAQGTPVPPQHPAAGYPAQAPAPVPPAPAGPAPVAPAPAGPTPVAPAPAAPAAMAPTAPTQWTQYDPWSAPGAVAPLSHAGVPPKKKSRRGTALAGALFFALLTGVLGGGVGAYLERNGGITTVELPQAGPEDSGRAPDSIAGIAASALPSVVTLHVSGNGEQGTGTGFVLDRQGHILTNNHVVDPAGTSGDISVTFSGGETADATLVGKDSGYDLAVVKVTGVSGLKPLPLGNSDNVRVGDPVVAIGAPFDLQNTVTAGIISAKERPITAGGEQGDPSDMSYVDALQTDAPINPGNSGGPLVDSKARVIGINSAIRAADSGSGPEGGGGQSGSIGLGFAIPINQGKRVAEELINTGKATHPVIGVSLDMKYTGDGARVGDKGRDGAPAVTADGPAAKAGIRTGDVITKVDGQRVHSGEELIVKIRAHRPGDRLELTVVRDGKEQSKTLTLGSSSGS
ncbi:trypsin-like peptidase domain-containing protein [Streptomyces sp. NPDC000410]|uniref:S1C family serine protease n=1 Tax=Streptomyces sp. NPDC000410 TaxID=3154254 RepID=UPI00332240AF